MITPPYFYVMNDLFCGRIISAPTGYASSGFDGLSLVREISRSGFLFRKFVFEGFFGHYYRNENEDGLYGHKKAAEFAEGSFGIIQQQDLNNNCCRRGNNPDFFPESADIIVGEMPGFVIFHRTGCAVADDIVDSFRAVLLHKDSAHEKHHGYKKIAREQIPFEP